MKALKSVIKGVKGYYKNTTAKYRGKGTEKLYSCIKHITQIGITRRILKIMFCMGRKIGIHLSGCSILKIKRMIEKTLSKKCLNS